MSGALYLLARRWGIDLGALEEISSIYHLTNPARRAAGAGSRGPVRVAYGGLGRGLGASFIPAVARPM